MVAFVFTEDEIDKNNEYYMNTNNSLKYDFIELKIPSNSLRYLCAV